MTHRMPVSLLLAAALGSGAAHAVVLHPDAPSQGSITNPGAAVMAQWGGGSAVAIAPNWFISTLHQGGSVASNVTFNGITYDVVEQVQVYDPARPGDGYASPDQTDLVLWRVDSFGGGPSTLASYTPIASTITDNTAVTIGGFGATRSGAAQTFAGAPEDGVGQGYAVAGGGSLLWGTNTIEESELAELFLNNDNTPDARGLVYRADFDGPNGTAEASVGNGDSGGGWFVFDGGWKLAGLSHGVDHPLRAIFDPAENLYAVSVAEYAGQINATIPEPATLMLLGSGVGVMIGWRRR